jgi:hypothetical protein
MDPLMFNEPVTFQVPETKPDPVNVSVSIP